MQSTNDDYKPQWWEEQPKRPQPKTPDPRPSSKSFKKNPKSEPTQEPDPKFLKSTPKGPVTPKQAKDSEKARKKEKKRTARAEADAAARMLTADGAARYRAWKEECVVFFASFKDPSTSQDKDQNSNNNNEGGCPFPAPTHSDRNCAHANGNGNGKSRTRGKGTGNGCLVAELLGICHHDVKELLRNSGEHSEGFLRKERLRWHPDRFVGVPREEDAGKAKEMFQLIMRLLDDFEVRREA